MLTTCRQHVNVSYAGFSLHNIFDKIVSATNQAIIQSKILVVTWLRDCMSWQTTRWYPINHRVLTDDDDDDDDNDGFIRRNCETMEKVCGAMATTSLSFQCVLEILWVQHKTSNEHCPLALS